MKRPVSGIGLLAATAMLAATTFTQHIPATAASMSPMDYNLVTPNLVDRVQQTTLDMTTLSLQSSPYDVNGDGRTDVLINKNFPVGVSLYINNGRGVFTEVAAGTWGPGVDRRDCEWGDFNRDGLPDVYCSVGADHGTSMTKQNELWLQGPALHFTNVAAAWGVSDPYGRGRNVVILDVNGDGYPDIFLVNKYPRADLIPSPDRLFINVQGTYFRDATEYGLDVEQGGENDVTTGDINSDGRPDIALCGDSRLYVYENVGGTSFHDVTTALSIPTNSCIKALIADVNGDGRADLVTIYPKKVEVRLQQSDGTFGSPTTSIQLVQIRDAAVGDMNGDGLRDVYVAQGPKSPSTGTNVDVPDTVLFGRGDGTFVPVTVPAAAVGASEAVSLFDAFANGRTEALVLNGSIGTRIPGQVQLIASVTTPVPDGGAGAASTDLGPPGA
jgi:hypothetical protein